jgi:hypothetical protein
MKALAIILILICSTVSISAQNYDAIIIKQCTECKLVPNGKSKSINPIVKNISKLYKGDKIYLSENDDIAIQITSNNVRILKNTEKNSTYSLQIVEATKKSSDKGELFTYYQTCAKSRNIETEEPPNNAVLYYDIPIIFTWEGTNKKNLSLYDMDMKQISTNSVSGKNQLILNPAEIGLKPNESYIWKLDNSTVMLFSIIDKIKE